MYLQTKPLANTISFAHTQSDRGRAQTHTHIGSDSMEMKNVKATLKENAVLLNFKTYVFAFKLF